MTWTAQDQSTINYARRKTCSIRPPSAKSEVIEDINTFSQTLMRKLPEFNNNNTSFISNSTELD